MPPSFSLIFSTLIHFLYPFIQLGYNLQHNLDITTVEVHEDLQIRKVPMLRDPLSVPRSDRDDLWRKEVLQQHQWMNLWEKTMVVKPKHLGGGPVRLGLSNFSVIEADIRSWREVVPDRSTLIIWPSKTCGSAWCHVEVNSHGQGMA